MFMSNAQFEKKDFTPLPAGEYLVRMNRFEDVITSKGGKAAKTSFQVIKSVGGDPEEKGVKNRLVFHYFNYENKNPKAQEIGQEQLNTFLESVGVEGGLEGIGYDMALIGDYLELPLIAKLGEVGEKEYTDRDGNLKTSKATNKITSFKSR
jgi:hypothetical protein